MGPNTRPELDGNMFMKHVKKGVIECHRLVSAESIHLFVQLPFRKLHAGSQNLSSYLLSATLCFQSRPSTNQASTLSPALIPLFSDQKHVSKALTKVTRVTPDTPKKKTCVNIAKLSLYATWNMSKQQCATKMCNKNVQQQCATKMYNNNVQQTCTTNMYNKHVQ